MQDRQHIHNDPLVDRGWAQMQAQLDEVMPVQNRRFVPWWILLLSIGVVFSLGAYGWMSFYGNTTVDTQNEQEVKSIPLHEKVPIAQMESKKTFNNIENNTNNENASNTAKTLPFASNTSSILQENIVKNENQPNQDVPTSTPLVKEENEKPKKTMFSNTETPIIVGNRPNEESIAPNLPEKTMDIIAALETVELDLLKENPPSIEKEIAFDAPKKSHLIIEAGVETGLGGSPQGGSLGLAYQHRINNKMDYEIGLSYQAVSIDLFSGALGSKSGYDRNGFNSQESMELFSALPVGQTYNWLRINRASLDVIVDRKINTRWAFGGGVQISYYTKAAIPVSGVAPFADTYTQLEFDENYDYNLYNDPIEVYPIEVIASNINIAGDVYQLELKRWQWSALLRTHYRISSHWEIEANYRKALTKWPDNKKTYGASSFVGLGLRYYIVTERKLSNFTK